MSNARRSSRFRSRFALQHESTRLLDRSRTILRLARREISFDQFAEHVKRKGNALRNLYVIYKTLISKKANIRRQIFRVFRYYYSTFNYVSIKYNQTDYFDILKSYVPSAYHL